MQRLPSRRMSRPTPTTALSHLALVVLSVATMVGATVAADRAYGWLRGAAAPATGLLFPPFATAHYETMEFSYTAHCNNLGLRGPDATIAKSKALRIAAIGDSFTYGWGVEFEDTWVHRVEAALRDAGVDAEILDLGVPGAGPNLYAEIAATTLPILQPDLVLVGLLQGDDLAQALETPPFDPLDTAFRLGRLTRWLYPHFSGAMQVRAARLQEKSRFVWSLINEEWRDTMPGLLQRMTPSQRARFDRMDGDTQRAFQDGRLNPALLTNLLFRSDRFDPQELDAASPLLQQRTAACATALASIAETAQRQSIPVLVVSIPAALHTDPATWENLRRLGRPADPRELQTTAMDDAARASCEPARLPFVEVTAPFRARAARERLYYPFDTHFTPAGHAAFAELLLPRLREFLAHR